MSKILFSCIFAVIALIAVLSVVTTTVDAFGNFNVKKNKKASSLRSRNNNKMMMENPTAAPNHGGSSSSKFPALSLFEQFVAALEAKDLNGVLSLLSDDFQGFFPLLYPSANTPVTKSLMSQIFGYYFSVWDHVQVQQFIQTASNLTVTGILDVNAVLTIKEINQFNSSGRSKFFMDDIRHFTMRTTPDGKLISSFDNYQMPAEGLQLNATKTAAAARLFYSSFAEMSSAKMMSFFTPDATYVEYGFNAQAGKVCNYDCIQDKFRTSFSIIMKGFLDVRDDADPIFVIFNKIGIFRKQFFVLPTKEGGSTAQLAGMNLASDVLEFDSTYKIRTWTAYYDAEQ